MEIKYVDVWPNDMSKNNGKGYGAAVSLRGIVDGEDVRVYPRGFVDRTLRTLIGADVIELGEYDDDPESKYAIDVLDGKKVQIMLDHPAGEKYSTFTALNLSRVTTPPKPGRETSQSRSGDDAQPYTQITATHTAPPEVKSTQRYLDAMKFVVDKVVPVWEAGKVPYTAADINAATATVMIDHQRRGDRSRG